MGIRRAIQSGYGVTVELSSLLSQNSDSDGRAAYAPLNNSTGFRYHDNWVRNLLIASSLNGRRLVAQGRPTQNKLELVELGANNATI
jgi:hypothetical protein